MYKINHLDNGIKVLHRHIDGVRSFSIGVYVKACSNYEDKTEIGISHLIEHMMFKGTEKYNAKRIAEIIDDVGGVMNAYTSNDCTAYYAKVLSEHAPLAIELLSDMLNNSKFLQADITKEIKVVKEEIAMYEDSPEDVVYELFQSAAYGSHPLARPILGYADDIDHLSRQHILNYIAKFYTADNTIIAMAGDIPSDIIAQLNDAFAEYKAQGKPINLVQPIFHGGYKFVNKEIEQNHMCVGFSGIPYGHKDYYCYLLISNTLGGTSSSLLFQKIREERGLAYSIYTHPTFFKQTGHFTIYTSYRRQNQLLVAQLIKTCLSELKNHFDEAVLKRAKAQLKGAYILGLESSTSIMASLGKRAIFDVEIETLDQMMQSIDAISLADVNRCVQSILSGEVALSMVGQVNENDVKAVYQVFNNGEEHAS